MQFDRARMLAVLPDVAAALSHDTAFEDGSPDRLKAWLDVGVCAAEVSRPTARFTWAAT